MSKGKSAALPLAAVHGCVALAALALEPDGDRVIYAIGRARSQATLNHWMATNVAGDYAG